MKYSKQERLVIGKQIYDGLLTVAQAAVKYSINKYTARYYLRWYKTENNLLSAPYANVAKTTRVILPDKSVDYSSLMELSKAELIDELIKSKVNEARAKKGYEVKGDGTKKEFLSLKNKNSK